MNDALLASPRPPLASIVTVPLLVVVVVLSCKLFLAAMSSVPPATLAMLMCTWRLPVAPTVFRWPLLVSSTAAQHRVLSPLPVSPSVKMPFALIVLSAPRVSWAPFAGIISVWVPLGPPSVSEWTLCPPLRTTL